MWHSIVNLLNNWKWVLFRGFFIAALFGFIFAIVFQWLHTPIWVYILVGIAFIVLAIYADRWAVLSYKKLTKAPSFWVEDIDYSQLGRESLILAKIQFLNRSVSRKIEGLNASVKYTSIVFNTVHDIAKESLEVDKKVMADELVNVEIQLRITSQDFYNEAIGASTQGLLMPLAFSLKWTVNLLVFGIAIPMTISYSATVSYSKSPNIIF